MKKVFIIIFLLYTCENLKAQLKHYITIAKPCYVTFFSNEKPKFKNLLSLPISFSYKIQHKKWGIELWVTSTSSSYNSILSAKTGDFILIDHDIISLNVQYAAYQHNKISINPIIGLFYRDFHARIFNGWYQQNQYHDPYPVFLYKDENNIGFQTGVNINLPIYRGIYANTNLRYNAIPWAKYNKQNLYWEIGLGYKIQRKKKQ